MANFVFVLLGLVFGFAYICAYFKSKLEKIQNSIKQIVSDLDTGVDRTRQSITSRLKELS